MRYKRYPEYKDSGVEWLGYVPAHWEVKKLSHWISSFGSGTTPSKESDYSEDGIPWVTTGELRENTIISSDKRVTPQCVASYSALKIHPAGSLIIAMYGATVGRTGRLGVPATSNQACFAIYPDEQIFLDVLAYWFQGFRDELIALATGAGQPNISADKIRTLQLSAPVDRTEQFAIAAFLDEKTTQIDQLIQKKTRFIELLKEKRQALITQAVTKGLNPDVEMKDSGSTWIGKIPAHWNMKKIRHISRSTSGGTPEKKNLLYWNGDISWVTPKDMKCQFIDSSLETITEKAVANSATSIICPGSILIVVRSGILKHTIPVAINTNKLAINQDIRAYSFDKQLHPEYFMRFVQGLNNTLLVYWRKQGATVESIETELLNASWIPVPPVLEQQHILEYLRQETLRIDTLINKTTQSIGLLKERRSALITAAVTGQIDLREAAA